MEFPYLKVIDFPKHQKRERFLPWIRFGIFNPKNKIKILYPVGLVDSGSDITIIDYEFAEELGIEIKKGPKIKVYGIGEGKIEVWFSLVGFILEDDNGNQPITYQDLVGFTYESFPLTMPQQTAILGTVGFFRHLKVTFDYPRSIVLEPK